MRGVACKMDVPGRGRNFLMSQQALKHRQVLPQCQRRVRVQVPQMTGRPKRSEGNPDHQQGCPRSSARSSGPYRGRGASLSSAGFRREREPLKQSCARDHDCLCPRAAQIRAGVDRERVTRNAGGIPADQAFVWRGNQFGGQESRPLTGAPGRGISPTRSVKLSFFNTGFLNPGGRMVLRLPTTPRHPFRNTTMSDSWNT